MRNTYNVILILGCVTISGSLNDSGQSHHFTTPITILYNSQPETEKKHIITDQCYVYRTQRSVHWCVIRKILPEDEFVVII